MNQTNNRIRDEIKLFITDSDNYSGMYENIRGGLITEKLEDFIDELLKSQREELVEKMKEEIKVDDYGEMLSIVTGLKLVSFKRFGSYQGDWIAVLDNEDNVEIWKGYYGSCSGCDWLEAKKNYEKGTVSLEKAREYFKEDRPFAVIPKETLWRIDVDTFEQMLPKNIRRDIYEFSAKELFNDIKKGLNN